MLRIEGLRVRVAGKEILRGVNLAVGQGEIIALLGPNGSGKSTLMHALMGHPRYEILSGKIFLNGEDITGLNTTERVRRGMGIMMQIPPSLKGVKLVDLLRKMSKMYGTSFDYLEELARRLGAHELLNRDIHRGFSGGEMKKAEVLLLAAQAPKIALLDEPDSGVDLESLPVLGKAIDDVLSGGDGRAYEKRSAIIVTHTGKILSYIKSVSRAYVILSGKISCFGDPKALLEDIERYGFEGCRRCVKVI